ncbi:MAG: hypothetical protein E3J69_07295 [Anaerolineales bacterium]|nr:MAG: hypothetical protein E3J69_07295 [Anaerolineales bacterium]
MVKRINAIKAYTPRIKLYNRAELDKVCKYISGQSSLNAGETKNVLFQLHDAILSFVRRWQPVKIDDIGTFTPMIHIDGSLHLNVRVDRKLIRKLNEPGFVTTDIVNKPNIGATANDLVSQWNENHPDAPVE